MLATLADHPPRDPEQYVYEMKYDGFRALASLLDGNLTLWSRNGIDLSARFPRAAEAVQKLRVDSVVLDGEIVALDDKGAPRFQLLQRGAAEDALYFVFDLLYLNGHDLRGEPVEQRRGLLEKLLEKPPKFIRIAEQLLEPPDAALADAARRGYEGLIAKRKGSTYENRRSKEWLKLKAVNSQELAVIGFTASNHSDREIGSLMLGVMEDGAMRYAGKVGSGFSAKERVQLKSDLLKDASPEAKPAGAPKMRDVTWTRPRIVAQVQFMEWTSDGKLRHPSLLGFRFDKKPAECIREKPEAVLKPAPKSPTMEKTVKKSATVRTLKTAKTSASRDSRKSAPTIVFTNPDRILYPRDGITKKDVAEYYAAVSDAMLHTLKERPLVLEHWNRGISAPSWFHQNIATREAEPWMSLVETPTRTSNREVRHLVADSPATLQWLAQHSVLTVHMWSSRAGSLERPDWLTFDLDPAKGAGIEQAVDTALVLRRLFEDLEIPSYPKTSGKRGIHLFVPLAPVYSHEEAVEFASRLGEAVASKLPYATVDRALTRRKGRLYLDCLQNGYGKTLVAPYSLRAVDGAPVSAPLQWSEINNRLDPAKFNLRTMPERLAKLGDLFAGATGKGVKLPRVR